MRALIFANGRLDCLDTVRDILRPDDLIIAADGGARHCQELGLAPDLLIGDFDSLSPEDLERFREQNVQIIPHPARKDQTDLELALRQALKSGANQMIVFGALGRRRDMSIANILLMAAPEFSGVDIRIQEKDQEIRVLRAGGTLRIQGEKGDTLSLLPLTGDAAGVSLEGLEYPLKDETLPFGATRGVSNVMARNVAAISLKQGVLLCLLLRNSSDESA